MQKTSSGIALAVLLLTSCSLSSSADLTRTQAKALLSKANAFTSASTKLSWVVNGANEFIAEGAGNNREFMKVVTKATTFELTIITPLRRRVDDITGIADAGQGHKDVFFRWSIVDVPSVLAPLVVVGGTGRVTMRLYDDGWRIESGPELSEDSSPHTLTVAQQRQMEGFREATRSRKREQESDIQQRQEKLKASETATKVLYHFRSNVWQEQFPKRQHWTDVDVTDANLAVTDMPSGNVHHKPWVCISSIRLQDGLFAKRNTISVIMGLWEPKIRDFMQGVGCSVSPGDEMFTTNSSEEGKQVYDEIQKAYQAWSATYGKLLPATVIAFEVAGGGTSGGSSGPPAGNDATVERVEARGPATGAPVERLEARGPATGAPVERLEARGPATGAPVERLEARGPATSIPVERLEARGPATGVPVRLPYIGFGTSAIALQREQAIIQSGVREIAAPDDGKSVTRVNQNDKIKFLVDVPSVTKARSAMLWADGKNFRLFQFEVKNGKRKAAINAGLSCSVSCNHGKYGMCIITPERDLTPGEYGFGASDPKVGGGLMYTFGINPSAH